MGDDDVKIVICTKWFSLKQLLQLTFSETCKHWTEHANVDYSSEWLAHNDGDGEDYDDDDDDDDDDDNGYKDDENWQFIL